MRALRVAAETVQLVLPGISPAEPPDRWAGLPPATKTRVLTLLAGLIAHGVLADEPARDESVFGDE